jgi:hypothetical protein
MDTIQCADVISSTATLIAEGDNAGAESSRLAADPQLASKMDEYDALIAESRSYLLPAWRQVIGSPECFAADDVAMAAAAEEYLSGPPTVDPNIVRPRSN